MPAEAPDLAARLAAEQAGVDFWREVARQRRLDAADVQRRPVVRVAVALDRRTRGAQRSIGRRVDRVQRAGRRAAVVVDGWCHAPQRRRRHREVDERATAPDLDRDERPVLVVHLGPAPLVERSHRTVSVEAVASPSGSTGRLTRCVAADIDARVRADPVALVCLVGPATRPWSATWLDRLTGPVGAPSSRTEGGTDPEATVVASIPVTVHPLRPWIATTAHDLLVRAAGLDLVVRSDGVPVARARGAGSAPAVLAAAPDPVSATAAGFACDRQAWLDVGGLSAAIGSGDQVDIDLDVAIVDLCLRLHRHGGRLALSPSAVLVDARPVDRRAELDGPIDDDGSSWRSLIEARGPSLVRGSGGGRADGGLPGEASATIALTTATPSLKMASRSGDWHFAQGLARALGRAGHRVRVQTHAEADALAGRVCDLHLVLRGLEPVRATVGQRHVIWIISHPEAIDTEECDRADLVLVASEHYARHLRTLTSTPVEVLHQATDHHLFRPMPVAAAHRHPVTVVAGTRGVARDAVDAALAAGLRPAVYGPGWEGRIDPGLWVADYIDHALLPVVYSSADLVLNDHWETMRHWGFVSNRIFDVMACGTPVVSDHLPEIGSLFGDLVPTWATPEDLGEIAAVVQADAEETRRRTTAARRLVLDHHTFDHRVVELSAHLARHGLGIVEETGP